MGQCLALATKTALPPRQYAEAVAALALVGLLLIALPAAAPRAFQRVRYLVAGGVRLLLFAQPVVRHPRGLLTVFQVRPRVERLARYSLSAAVAGGSRSCTSSWLARRARPPTAQPACCTTCGACCWAVEVWRCL